MKRALLPFVLALTSLTLWAQHPVLKLGGGWASHYGGSTRNVGAIKIGVGYEVELGGLWSVEPGVYYMAKGWKDRDRQVIVYDEDGEIVYDDEGNIVTGLMNVTSNTNYVELPVLVNYYVPLSTAHYLSFSAGPYVAWGVGGKAKTSGDTEQVTEKLDKGLLDFAVICDAPNGKKYDAIAFPEGDIWGLILPVKDPLAQKETIRVDDLIGLPLFTSKQGWEGDIRKWAGDRFPELHLEGSFRLAYNASMFVRKGLGYQLSFRHLVDVSESSGLTFRPLEPRLESKLYLIWNRYQAFTPIAERFIEQIRRSFV